MNSKRITRRQVVVFTHFYKDDIDQCESIADYESLVGEFKEYFEIEDLTERQKQLVETIYNFLQTLHKPFHDLNQCEETGAEEHDFLTERYKKFSDMVFFRADTYEKMQQVIGEVAIHMTTDELEHVFDTKYDLLGFHIGQIFIDKSKFPNMFWEGFKRNFQTDRKHFRLAYDMSEVNND